MTKEVLLERFVNMNIKPGYNNLSKSNKENYEQNLQDHFKTKAKKFDEKKIFERDEVEAFILRFILTKCQANNEFDFLLFIKVSFINTTHMYFLKVISLET